MAQRPEGPRHQSLPIPSRHRRVCDPMDLSLIFGAGFTRHVEVIVVADLCCEFGIVQSCGTRPVSRPAVDRLPVCPSLGFSPHSKSSILLDFDVDHVRATTHGTVLHVLLVLTCRQVKRYDDFFAAGVACIGAFVVHGVICYLDEA